MKKEKFDSEALPPIPTNTCPYIDHAIHVAIELSDIVDELAPSNNLLKAYSKSLLETLKGTLEHVRTSNDLLRQSGKYWYKKAKKRK